ncbi:MAG: alpha/beta hydrolase fold domain-containing protein [Rubripirellula sp.]
MKLKPLCRTIVVLALGIATSQLLSLSGALAQQPSLEESVRIERDLPYVSDGHERQKLDLYVPKSVTNPPLVVWIHGGGWAKGSKSGIGSCRWVLDEGYALASIGYRLTDTASFPAQLEDCQSAIRWLKINASDHGYDAANLVVWGSSAGGHLVAMLGTTGDPTSQLDDVSGVIDWFGPSELLTMQAQRTLPTRLDADAPDSFESRLVGGPLQEEVEIAKQASPITHVDSSDAPFLIMHGDRDPLVSLTQSQTLHAKLQAVGVSSKLVVLPGAGHGGPAFMTEKSRDTIREFLEEHLRPNHAADAFVPLAADRILFLGDSNTFSGQYITLLEQHLVELGHASVPELINMGLSSETCTGLSEPAHPFPRPNVHERIDRALAKSKPDVVVACYGMNDGIYYPFSEDRYSQFCRGIDLIIEKVQASGAKLILMTPPAFDPLPCASSGKLLPAGAEEYSWKRIYENYDADVIAVYAKYVREQAERVAMVVDLYDATDSYIRNRRHSDEEFSMSPDGVHVNLEGHAVVASAICRAWEIKPIDPAEAQLDRQHVQAQQVMRDAWLSEVGHLRPGIKEGLPLDQATAMANQLRK